MGRTIRIIIIALAATCFAGQSLRGPVYIVGQDGSLHIGTVPDASVIAYFLTIENGQVKKYEASSIPVSWEAIRDKPSTFPPSDHTHTRDRVIDLWTAPFWTMIPDKPNTFPPSAHNHSASEITSGTLSTARYSAYADLVAESKIGMNSGQVSHGDHLHTGVYEPIINPGLEPQFLAWDKKWKLIEWPYIYGKPEVFTPASHDHAFHENMNSTLYYHLTQANHIDLTDGGNSALHYHSTDRDRANHTGTQAQSTIVGLVDSITAHRNAIATKLTANTPITGATKCKITYDTKGLVTAGADLTATDIPNLSTTKLTSGTLGVARGGTGASTFTAGYLKANGTNAFTTVSQIPYTDISPHDHGTGSTNYIPKFTDGGVGTIGNSDIINDGYAIRTYKPIELHNSGDISAFYTDNSYPLIYATATSSGSYPFSEYSNLIIQTRSTTNRDILFVTGTTPTIRMVIRGDGNIYYPQLNASSILELNASRNLISVSKGTAYNKNFGTAAGTVAEGNHSHDDRYYTETESDALLANKRDYQKAVISVPAAGWYRVAKFTYGDGRGMMEVEINTTGGSYAPYRLWVRAITDYASSAVKDIEAVTSSSAYWDKVRITYDGSNKFVEVYFKRALNASAVYSEMKDFGWAGSLLYTGELPAGGDTEQSRVDLSTSTPAYTYSNMKLNGNTVWHEGNLTPYTHPTQSTISPTLSGANVLASLSVNTLGHVTAATTRALTPSDIGAQPSDATLTALAGLNSTAGFVYQTGADVFTKYPFGTAANTVAQGNDSRIVNGQTAYGWGDHSGLYLPIGGGTLTGNLAVGTSSTNANRVISVRAGDAYNCGFEAYGSSQGTGYTYVGQSSTTGGGMFYNGDGNPSFATDEVIDRVTFYRRTGSTNYSVFYYPYNSNDVTFLGKIYAENNKEVWHAGNFSPTNYVSQGQLENGNYLIGAYRLSIGTDFRPSMLYIEYTSTGNSGEQIVMNRNGVDPRNYMVFSSNEAGGKATIGIDVNDKMRIQSISRDIIINSMENIELQSGGYIKYNRPLVGTSSTVDLSSSNQTFTPSSPVYRMSSSSSSYKWVLGTSGALQNQEVKIIRTNCGPVTCIVEYGGGKTVDIPCNGARQFIFDVSAGWCMF